jgi:hypothetical protein
MVNIPVSGNGDPMDELCNALWIIGNFRLSIYQNEHKGSALRLKANTLISDVLRRMLADNPNSDMLKAGVRSLMSELDKD